MSFDNVCKLLSEKYPDRFASWVLGTPQPVVEVLKTELSIEPIRADYVTLLQLQGQILHLEFQTRWESNPPISLRMLDYWVRLYRLYRLPIAQVVVLLLPPPDESVIETAFVVGETQHRYRVIRLWEEDAAVLLDDPALLPLATLAACNPHLRTSIGIGGATGEPARRESPSRSFRLCQNSGWVKIQRRCDSANVSGGYDA